MFDLDNTLYPHHLNLGRQVDERIRNYVANFLKLSYEDAVELQKDYYKRYGATMRGLMAEHGMRPDDSSTRSTIRRSNLIMRLAQPSRSYPAGSSSSPMARASIPTR